MKKILCPYQALVMIINEDQETEDKLLELLELYHIEKTMISKAKGTAPSSISDFFGFGVVEKMIVTTMIPSIKAKDILTKLTQELELNEKNKGIVLTLPLTGMDSRLFQQLEERK